MDEMWEEMRETRAAIKMDRQMDEQQKAAMAEFWRRAGVTEEAEVEETEGSEFADKSEKE